MNRKPFSGIVLVSIMSISMLSYVPLNSLASHSIDVSPEFLSIKIPKDSLKGCKEYSAKTILITNVGEDSVNNITIQPSGEWVSAMKIRVEPSVISLEKTKLTEHPTAEIRIFITPTGGTLQGSYNGKIIIQSDNDATSVSVVVSVPHTPLTEVNACGEGHVEPDKGLPSFSVDLRFDTKHKIKEVKAGEPFTAILELTNTGNVPLKNTVAEIILAGGLSTTNSKIKHPQLIRPDDHTLFKWKVNTQKTSSDFMASITVKIDTFDGSKSTTKEIKIKQR